MKDHLKNKRADPIISQGYKFEFPRGQIAVGESLDVCVKVQAEYPLVRF